eukprot:3942917-Amphidinium_carterae.1
MGIIRSSAPTPSAFCTLPGRDRSNVRHAVRPNSRTATPCNATSPVGIACCFRGGHKRSKLPMPYPYRWP